MPIAFLILFNFMLNNEHFVQTLSYLENERVSAC